MTYSPFRLSVAFLAAAPLSVHGVSAEEIPPPDLQSLRLKIEQQAKALEQQARQLERQRQELDEQRRALQKLVEQQGGAPQPSAEAPPAQRQRPAAAQATPPGAAQGAAQGAGEDTATRPPEETRPTQEIAIIADVGGVLTPRGTLTIEPQLTASHTSSNRFFFQGVEIVEAVLIGAIEATEARRNYVAPQLGLRFGLTNRMEISAKVPFVYRSDRVESTVVSEVVESKGEPMFIRDLTGRGLGDIEFGMQYQLNDGQQGWPFLIANLRAKSPTGKGPFSVSRDKNGVETELATGSGFWGIEPSLTMIYPTDPAVLFLNVGYLLNLSRNVNLKTGNSLIERVAPGDTVSGSFGVGFALNETLSLSLGYQHNYIFGTASDIDGKTFHSKAFQVGALLFGISLRLAESTMLNMNVSLGVTDDSPDVEFSLRVPFSAVLF